MYKIWNFSEMVCDEWPIDIVLDNANESIFGFIEKRGDILVEQEEHCKSFISLNSLNSC